MKEITMKLKRILCMFALFLILFAPAVAQSVDSLFVGAPASVLPLLTTNSRLDLLDLFNSQLEAVCTNELGGITALERKDESSIRLRLSAHSRWEMVCIAGDADTAIIVLKTLRLPAADTEIRVYDSRWNPKSFILSPLEPENFLKVGAQDEAAFREKIQMLRPRHYAWTWLPERERFRVVLSTESLPEQERKEVAAMTDSLTYRWTGRAFEPEK